MIKAMKFVAIPVSDQQRALEFYTTKLGFRVITDQPFNDKQRWIELGVGRSGTGVTRYRPGT
jgi:catechol 2,3-dioxygenase-like lactoylglutathione lyase family enzyme